MHKYSFSKTLRVLKRSEFLHISATGKKITDRFFIGLYTPGKFDRTRLGITVTKRLGCAKKRNRIKRITREYFRLNKYKIAGNWDINIIANKEASVLSSDQMRCSLKSIFDTLSRRKKIESDY